MKEIEFSLELVEKLIDIAKSKDIAKLNLSFENFKIAIDLNQPVISSNFANVAHLQNAAANLSSQTNPFLATEKVKDKVVKSPIVGVFYDRPSPEKPPFVKIGDRVKIGDVLFIIEAMKVMNEIKSEFDGVVSDILVSAGDGVEYGEAIIVLE